MLFPEFKRSELNSMKPSKALFLGLRRRIFNAPKDKVFIIGFHKTGTSSMGKALQILGYRVCGSIKEGLDLNSDHLNNKNQLKENTYGLLDRYNAFQDTPWFLLYKELYNAYPNSKFILTIRDEDKWIKSVQKHFGDGNFQYHSLIYGSNDSIKNEKKYRDTYNKHNIESQRFFADKDKEILVINLEKDTEKWKLICGYLNVKQPNVDFPYVNKANDSLKISSRLKKIIKKIYYN